MSCTTEPAKVWPAKDPSAKLDYYVDFERECARFWQAGTDFANGVAIRPLRSAGYEWVSAGGRSGAREPTWIGATVTDGSITWTRQALSSASLRRTISGTPTWTADAGITVSGESVSGLRASAFIESGTDGQDYTVIVTASMSDTSTVPVVCVLPVRRAVRVCEA